MTKETKNFRQEEFEFSQELEILRTQNPFRVPENYFEHLPADIQKRKSLGNLSLSPGMVLFSYKVRRYAVGLAICASVLLLFFLDDSARQNHLSADTELFYNDYLDWYADYQQVDVYELILAANNWPNDIQDDSEVQLYDYLFSYSYYNYSFFEDISE